MKRSYRNLLPLGATVAAAALFLPATAVRADDVGEQVYQRALKSAVFICEIIKDPASGHTGIAMGSGSLIDKQQRLVLTNYHVIEADDNCFVQFPQLDTTGKVVLDKKQYIENIRNGKAIKGRVLYKDSRRDCAIVQLASVPKSMIPIRISDKTVRPGARVHSIGNPGASDAVWVYTEGKVRQVYPKKFLTGNGHDLFFEVNCSIVETTSPTNPGDSGGPLLNDKGELIAITQGYKSFMARQVSYFIDIAEIKTLLKEKGIALGDQPKDGGLVPIEEPQDTPDPKAAAKTKPAGSANKEAERKLEFARGLAVAGRKEAAIRKYKEVIGLFPGTKEARSAQDGIDELNKKN